MKSNDEHIRDLFQSKLKGAQAPVDPAIWSAVQSGLPGAAGAAGAASGGTAFTGMTAWLVAAVVGVGIATAVIFAVSGDDDKQSPVVTEVQAEVIGEKQDETTQEAEVEDDVAVSGQAEVDLATSQEVKEKAGGSEAHLANASTDETSVPQIVTGGLPDTIHSHQVDQSVIEPTASGAQANSVSQASSANPNPVETTVPMTARFAVVKDPLNDLNYQFIAECDDAANYEWSIDGFKYSGSRVELELEEGEQVVRLRVTDENGEYDVHESTVKAYRKPEVKKINTFTPFGSPGENDVFDLQVAATNIILRRVVVMDGQGTVVYDSVDQEDPWDGYDRFGNKCPIATYTYQYEGIDVFGSAVAGGGYVIINDN